MECFLCRVLNSKPYQYFWFNYLQPNQDWWQGYLSAGRNHDTPPSFRLPCLNILKSPSQASKSSKKVTNPHFTVAGPGWWLEQVQVTTGAAFLPRRAPPHCTTAHNAHVHVPGWLTPQIFTPYFATKNIYTVFCNKSFIFFYLKLLTAPCSADTPSIYTIICNQLLNWSFYRTRVRSLAMLVSNSVTAV